MDFITDNSCRHLNRLHTLTEVPDYVKRASLDPADIKQLPDHLFGNPAAREFPIDTPGHVYLSYAYAKSAGIVSTQLGRKLKAAAQLHQMEKDLDNLDQLFHAPVTKSASSASKAAISFEKEGQLQHFFPLNTESQVEDSIQKVAQQRHRFPLPLFIDACRNIVKAAAELGMEASRVPRSMRRLGEDRWADTGYIKVAATARARHTGDDIYEHIARLIAESPASEDMDKYAEAWLQADLSNGLEKYGPQTEDPYSIIFSGVTKVAADKYLDQFILVADTPVPVREFAKLSKDTLAKHFPQAEAAELVEIVKVASEQGGAAAEAVLSTKLPSGHQRTLLSLLLR